MIFMIAEKLFFLNAINNNNNSFIASLFGTPPPAGPRILCAEARWKNPAAAGEQCFGSRY